MSSSSLDDSASEFIINHLTSNSTFQLYKELKCLEAEQSDAESSRRPGQSRRYIDRNREEGHKRLWKDYFDEHPVFPPQTFRRRFRMRRELFVQIVNGISNHSIYFQQRKDALGNNGLSPLQKCTAAIRQLAYGTTGDLFDEYIRIGESTSIECLQNFCRCVIEVYSSHYLRKPNANDIQNLLQTHSEKHGFPGMLGSIDCMHWPWKNCPVAWQGQYTRGDQGCPTSMLEAVASQDLWIWHAYFGVAGSNNDINVLNQSPLFNDVLQDGIYPEWATMVKSFPHPADPKRIKFKEMQEAARKDVERAFGVLQSRWAIVRGPARSWQLKNIKDIMYTCIILHNMIVENEGNAISNWSDDVDPPIRVNRGPVEEVQYQIQRNSELRDNAVHHALRHDLMEHIWERFINM
ncbi:uncharacterized protein LOC111919209 isoform X1 [Lactuca sativa]|uniref:uncharacterized protein LOC111919209 isoform X1 n=1 Tax=Lactuca sativa TaxID=4236 RepID=UPI0022AE8046|nr:uncharacterized protein LOC111919209 isoform X1 [Lactuca sativa]